MSEYKAIMYLRLSEISDSKTENNESDSIANQRKYINDFVINHPNIEIVSEKVDDGFTGMFFERPAFQEMMNDVESGAVNCIIVKDLSRFGREYIELGKYLRDVLPLYHVRFIAINDNLDTADENGYDELSISLKSILNDNYCKDISEKTKSSLLSKRRNGEFIGSFAMYGYMKTKEDKNKLIVDPYASKIVQYIFSLKIKGYSANNIANKLNNESILSPLAYRKSKGLPHAKKGITDSDNAKWSANAIFRILQNPVYVGTLEQGKVTTKSHKLKELEKKSKKDWIVTENAHEPIVTNYLFNLTQDILRLDTRTSQNRQSVFVFSGLLICGDCGKQMTRKTVPANGKDYFYYYCPTGKKKNCYAQNMINEQLLVDCVTHTLQSHIYTLIGIHDLVMTLNEDSFHKASIKKLELKIEETRLEIAEAESAKSQLLEKHLAKALSKSDLRYMENLYEKQLFALCCQLEEEKEKLANSQVFDNGRFEWITHFKNYGEIKKLTREIVVQLIESIIIHDKKQITVTFRYQDEYKQYLEFIEKERVAV